MKEKNSEKLLSDSPRMRRIAAVIFPLFFLSLLFAAIVISLTNDIYAFVKPNKTVTLELSESLEVSDVAEILGNAEVVNNPGIFTLYVISKGAEERITNFSGEIILNSSMSYREILKKFSNAE